MENWVGICHLRSKAPVELMSSEFQWAAALKPIHHESDNKFDNNKIISESFSRSALIRNLAHVVTT